MPCITIESTAGRRHRSSPTDGMAAMPLPLFGKPRADRTSEVDRVYVSPKQVELLLLLGYHQFSAKRCRFHIRSIEGQPTIQQPVYQIDMLIIDN